MQSKRIRSGVNFLPLLIILLIWEIVSGLSLIPSTLFPPPSRVTKTTIELFAQGMPPGHQLHYHTLYTLIRVLAGFTLALQSTRLVAVTGLITGIAASLSMSASEYLSEKSEGGDKEPLKAALYTGTAYTFTVLFLVLPYLVLLNVYYSLIWTITNAIIIILVFTFYVSVARGVSFRRRFCEMAGISLGVAGLTFVIGYLVRVGLGVEV